MKEGRLPLDILTLCRDFASVSLEFMVLGTDLIDRQPKTWARFPDAGRKVFFAAISTTDGNPLW